MMNQGAKLGAKNYPSSWKFKDSLELKNTSTWSVFSTFIEHSTTRTFRPWFLTLLSTAWLIFFTLFRPFWRPPTLIWLWCLIIMIVVYNKLLLPNCRKIIKNYLFYGWSNWLFLRPVESYLIGNFVYFLVHVLR